MAIPTQEELDAACVAQVHMIVGLRKLGELLKVARDRGTNCNGVFIPLTDDLIQPLIDKYDAEKAGLVALFQSLP